MLNTSQFRVEFELDDGYGGLYPITASVRVWVESERVYAEVLEMEGPQDQDGAEISRLQKQADEEAIEKACDLWDAERPLRQEARFCGL